MGRYRAAVKEYLDQREEAARKDGNKKIVDQVKTERQAFEGRGELPKGAPAAVKQRAVAAVKQRAVAAKKAMTAAYADAVKEYTKAKKDDLAAALEKELAAFAAGPDLTDTRRRWVHETGDFRKLGSGEWEEKSPNGKAYRYKVNAATKDYVELDALTGNLTVRVRLYDTKCVMGNKPNPVYKQVFKGGWEK